VAFGGTSNDWGLEVVLLGDHCVVVRTVMCSLDSRAKDLISSAN